MAASSFLQSADWARFQRAVGHNVVVHNGYQFFESKIPGGAYLYCPHPAISDWNSFTRTALEVANKERAWFVRAEPFLGSREHVNQGSGIKIVPTREVQPAHTFEVALNDDQAMLAAMHQKTRYNIRVAEKAGVTVRFDHSGQAADTLVALLAQTSERANIRLHERSYYPTMLQILGANHPTSPAATLGASESGHTDDESGEPKLSVEVAFAYLQEQPIAAALLAWWDNKVVYLHGGSNYEHRNVMGPHLLHWTAMQRARDAGKTVYDMGGVSPEGEQHHPWAGISRFKRGFGGQTITYPPAVDVVVKPVAYRTYTLARTIGRLVR